MLTFSPEGKIRRELHTTNAGSRIASLLSLLLRLLLLVMILLLLLLLLLLAPFSSPTGCF